LRGGEEEEEEEGGGAGRWGDPTKERDEPAAKPSSERPSDEVTIGSPFLSALFL